MRADTTDIKIWTDLLYIMIDLVALSCLSLPSPAHCTLNSEHPELSSQEHQKTVLNSQSKEEGVYYCKLAEHSVPRDGTELWNAATSKKVRPVNGIILYRVPAFLSSRLNWVPPPPPPQSSVSPAQASVSPPQEPSGGETHLLAGEGVGGAQFRRLSRNSATI